MGANLNTIFVIDVESTCWETPEEQGDQPNELIEIGIVSLALSSLAVKQKRSYAIKPRFTKVSEFCTKLTGWRQEDMDAAPDIAKVLVEIGEEFKITRNHVWFSCGEYDRIKLSNDAAQSGSIGFLYTPLDNPIARMRAHYNIKTLFALKYSLPREMGMMKMLAYINEQATGKHHNGADDAENIAKIVKHFLT